MQSIHIVTEEQAGDNILHALLPQVEKIELFVLQDTLNIGLLKTDGMNFSEGRSYCMNQLFEENRVFSINDLEKLMTISTRLSNDKNIELCYWMAANANDICCYFWLLHYLKKHCGKLSVINISGLPFIDANQVLFYPSLLSELPQKEILKAFKLKRQLTLSEWEADADEWKQLVENNADIRMLSGAKKIESTSIDTFDNHLLQLCSSQSKRVSTIIQQAGRELKQQVTEVFLGYRLRTLEKQGKVSISQNKVILKNYQQQVAQTD